jgi:hypothetical protein
MSPSRYAQGTVSRDSGRGEGGERKPERVRRQPGCSEQHRSELHHLRPDRDLALAEPIRQPATRHAQNQKWHREEERHYLPFGFCQIHPDDHREKQVAQDVVAEGALELRGD